jgi:hypothetical protein
MKTYLLLILFVLGAVLFAQHNSQFSAWRFVNQNGEDWYTDTSEISFEAELNPGSGDILTLNDNGVEIVLEDIGNGTISSFIVFNFGNFNSPWEPDNLIRIKIEAPEMLLGKDSKNDNYDEIIVPCSLIFEAPYPFYGWQTEGYGTPFASEPLVIEFYPWWRNLNWGNGVVGMTRGMNDGVPSNELIHNENGECPMVNEIPFFGETGYFFMYTVHGNTMYPFLLYL